jgi:hypothetical protein
MRSTSLLALADSIMGVADPTLGRHPIHGLRHTPEGNTNGWYVWAGEYSWATDFFSHLQTAHLLENAPEVLKSFGLRRGCRFLLAKDYANVWFSAALLITGVFPAPNSQPRLPRALVLFARPSRPVPFANRKAVELTAGFALRV